MTSQDLPILAIPSQGWDRLLDWGREGALMEVVAEILPSRRWFGGKSRSIKRVHLESAVPLEGQSRGVIFLCLLKIEYSEGKEEWYSLSLARAKQGEVPLTGEVASLEPPSDGFTRLVDGFFVPETGVELVRGILSPEPVLSGLSRVRTEALEGRSSPLFSNALPKVFGGEQSNTSLLFGHDLILKGFRKLEPGLNPDLEIGVFLARSGQDVSIPTTFGALLGQTPSGDPLVLALLQEFVDNQGDAWTWFLKRLPSILSNAESPESLDDMVLRLGRATARLHRALGGDSSDPEFAPLPFGAEDLSRLAGEIGERLDRVWKQLATGLLRLASPVRLQASALIPKKGELESFVAECLTRGPGGVRIRCHGDFHLGQVLVTPRLDVVFLDFEGEPALPLAMRRHRSTPLLDVAGMLRSFHYVALSAIRETPSLLEVAKEWYRAQCGRFLRAYGSECLKTVGLLPLPEQAEGILGLCLLRKTLYEMEYELDNRPDWAGIPLSGIELLLESPIPEFGGGD